MPTLTPGARRALRAKAHHLHPVVAIGQHGLTAAVLHEIDVNLSVHELIKIRVFSDARAERAAMLERICSELGAAEVQHLGKLLIVWRAAPEEEPAPVRRAPTGKAAARKAPQARRPRSPLPRSPGPPPRARKPLEAPAAPGSRRRRASPGDARRPRGALGVDDRPRGSRLASDSSRDPKRGASGKPRGKPSFNPPARPAMPHGKSTSSFVGASGARRRRRKAG